MTKKDYKGFADLIRKMAVQRTDWSTERLMLAEAVAKIFQTDNPNFSRDKFLVACGIQEKQIGTE